MYIGRYHSMPILYTMAVYTNLHGVKYTHDTMWLRGETTEPPCPDTTRITALFKPTCFFFIFYFHFFQHQWIAEQARKRKTGVARKNPRMLNVKGNKMKRVRARNVYLCLALSFFHSLPILRSVCVAKRLSKLGLIHVPLPVNEFSDKDQIWAR